MSEKQSIFKTVLLGIFILLGIWMLGNSPIFQTKVDTTTLTFEERHEEKLKASIESLLSKFYSKKAFFVAVKVISPDHKKTESIELDPKQAKSIRKEDYDGNLGEVFSGRPSFGLLNKLQQQDLDLPGLVSEGSGPPTERLPGFPSMDELAANPSLAQELASGDDGEPEFSISKETEEVYYNQRKEVTAQSKTKIDQLRIQIVIDETTAKLRPLSKEGLESYIKNSIGFQISRDDIIQVEYEYFQGTFFVFQRFLFRHTEAFSSIQAFFVKYDLIIITLCLIWLTIVACFGLITAYFRRRKDRILKVEEEHKVLEEKQQLEIERRKLRIKKQRTELSVIAETKPQALAHTILGLLTSTGQRDKENE
ncbi:hypothetical protein DID80_03845 [Candidatus Marinamargulisbacteria bacterium SCGC AAA071-K20]|nr:hypothetical protein DID80_03845 [Candidatus Marinamargulisbacteria bacterium SCGC AAA071-K20]